MIYAPRRHVIRLLVFLLVANSFALVMIEDSKAFNTQNRWPQGIRTQSWRWDFAAIDGLRVRNAQNQCVLGFGASIRQAITNTSQEWNKASWFTFSGSNQNSGNLWSAANLRDDFWGVANHFANPAPGSVQRVEAFLNTDDCWNLNGADPDVAEVSQHEWGHWLVLGDNPQGGWEGIGQSVMFNPANKFALYIDDKEGASMMYGIYTQFEQSQFLGLYQIPPSYDEGVNSFGNCGSGFPDYWTYTTSSQNIQASPQGGRVM
jgi:hypothetical protein